MKYAQSTSVPVDRSRLEIEALIRKAGADEIQVTTSRTRARIGFLLRGRMIRVDVSLPEPDEARFSIDARYSWKKNSAEKRDRLWQAELRRKWRVVLLTLRAKLELIHDGDSTIDREFFADLVTADGTTIGERLLPAIAATYKAGGMPALPAVTNGGN